MNPLNLFSAKAFKLFYGYFFHLKQQLTQVQKLRKQFPAVRFPYNLHLSNTQNLTIGAGTVIGGNTYLDCGKVNTARITIGNNVVIAGTAIIKTKEAPISIGDDCDIGFGAKLFTFLIKTTMPASSPEHIHEPVEIGRGCMIAAGAIILGGTTLGDNCIVSAGSVVKGKYPPNTTLIGNPARPVPRVPF